MRSLLYLTPSSPFSNGSSIRSLLKVFFWCFTLASFFACEKEDIAQVDAPTQVIEQHARQSANQAPFYQKYASLLSDLASTPEELYYDPGLDALIYQGDIIITEAFLAKLRIAAGTTAKPTLETEEKHRAFDLFGRWGTVRNADAADITVHIQTPTEAGVAVFPPEEPLYMEAVERGILSWNNSPDCRINIRLVNANQNPDCRMIWARIGDVGQAAPPDGDVGELIVVSTEFFRPGDQLFLNFPALESTAAHEMGHCLGLDHTDANFAQSRYICNSEVAPTNSIMRATLNSSAPETVTTGDLEALRIMYPNTFPPPTLNVSYNFNGFLGGEINYTYSAPAGLLYGKAKVIILDLLTGTEVVNQVDCFTGFGSYLIPPGGNGRQYRVSVQSLNWREDRGSRFARQTVFVP
ncbi:MAG: hypothetical protein AAFP77_04720 [Bacteroidota bacterium]